MLPDRTPLKERTQGRWRQILPQFGVDARHLDGKHHPCPLCGGKDRWRFDDLRSEGTSICGQCGARSGIALVMELKGLVFAEAARQIEEITGVDAAPTGTAKSAAKPKTTTAEALALWREGRRITPGDPVDLYLRRRLGTYNPDLVPALRFHPALRRYEGGPAIPGMLSAFTDPNRDICGLQRTFLTEDGQKDARGIDRLFIGELQPGGAVRLGPVGAAMGIAEGVETALSAGRLYNLTVWSGLTAGGVQKWQPPDGVEQIVVFADADENFTGQSAAFQLAHHLMSQKAPGTTNQPKYQVQVELPPEIGMDFNDLLARTP